MILSRVDIIRWLGAYEGDLLELDELIILYKELSSGDINAIDYSMEKITGTNTLTDLTGIKAIKMYLLQTRINILENRTKLVDRKMDKLNEIEKKLIHLRYIKKLKRCDVAEACSYSTRNVNRILDRALIKMMN